MSNPVREMSCKIWEKMLHTRFKAESSSDSLVLANSTYQRLSAFFFPKAITTAQLIWTRLIGDGKFEKYITQKVQKNELPASFAQLALAAYSGDE